MEENASVGDKRTKGNRVIPQGCLVCGFLTGAFSSAIFTPFDKGTPRDFFWLESCLRAKCSGDIGTAGAKPTTG